MAAAAAAKLAAGTTAATITIDVVIVAVAIGTGIGITVAVIAGVLVLVEEHRLPRKLVAKVCCTRPSKQRSSLSCHPTLSTPSYHQAINPSHYLATPQSPC